MPYRENGESYYPPYLVVATSIMGVVLARRLAQWRMVQWPCYQFMHALYIGKLCMLVLPEARMAMPVSLLLLVATPPLFIPMRDGLPDFKTQDVLPDPSGKLSIIEASPGYQTRVRRAMIVISTLLFVMQLGCVGIARLAVFDMVAAAWGGPPPEGVLLCALLVTAALAITPLIYRWYPNSVVRCRALLTVFLLLSYILSGSRLDCCKHGRYPQCAKPLN